MSYIRHVTAAETSAHYQFLCNTDTKTHRYHTTTAIFTADPGATALPLKSQAASPIETFLSPHTVTGTVYDHSIP